MASRQWGSNLPYLLPLFLLIFPGPGFTEPVECEAGGCGCCICLPLATPIFRSCSPLAHQSFAAWPSPPLSEILPGSFQNGQHLLSLNLSHNAPPEMVLNNESFVGLTSLTKLYLQANDITTLPDGLFSPIVSLELLNLEQNKLHILNSNAFTNLSHLSTLLLGGNALTEFPPDLLQHLPSLTNISLHPNPWNCSSTQILSILQLLQLGLVSDAAQLTCSNSTLISDIIIEVPTLPPSSISSSSPITPSTTSPSLPSSPQVGTSSVTISLQATPTPAPSQMNCSREENVATLFGFLDWEGEKEGGEEEVECPNGPEGGVVRRECGVGGRWGEVEGEECNEASVTTQSLVDLSHMVISSSNSLSISSLLSSSLTSSSSSSSPLSMNEVEVVIDLVGDLLQTSSGNVQVLNNTLRSVDALLTFSGPAIANGGTNISSRLRSLIDTALLASLSANQPNLVLMFSHLAVGGVFIADTNSTHILATITTGGEGEGVMIGVSGEGGEEGDVEVEVDGKLQGPVQVTVYTDSSLFNTTSCGTDDGKKGDEIAPIINISNEPTSSQETITLTFHGVKVGAGDSVVCVRWNSSLNTCQGGWQTDGCRLDVWTDNDLICICRDNGTFTILETQSNVERERELGGVVRYILYIACGLAFLLYLPVITAVLLNRSLRSLPLKQCTANMAASQSLSFVLLASSLPPHAPPPLCYTLGVLLHLLLLVSLLWFCCYPVLVLLKVVRRRWFEQPWMLAPVATFCWVVPAVLIGAIGAARYSGFNDHEDTETCWLESDVFPNYFTYLSVLLVFLSLLLSLLAVFLLYCSDYDLEFSVHLRVVSAEANALLFSLAAVCQFVVADSAAHSNKYLISADYLTLVVAVLVLLCAGHFLVANGFGNSHIRAAILCREDPVLKRKVAHYGESHTSSSVVSSRTSEHRNLRRSAMHLTDEMNLNYVNSYLGYRGEEMEEEEAGSNVPLDMLQQVNQRKDGQRVRDRRSGGELCGPLGGPTGFRNVGFTVTHITSMV